MHIPAFLNPSNFFRYKGISTLFHLVQVSNWFSNLTKRFLDIGGSTLALVLLSPVFGLIALAIKRDSPGPVFYRGERMGRGGKKFNILKFRTMHETPVSYLGPKVTAHDDTRITPLGRWLRDTKLNEMPQFWNVLKGEMSLVGPRPEDPGFTKTWPEDVRKEILSVRPGITSPASVLYRNEESLLNARNVIQQYIKELIPNKIRLDQLYVHHRSFLLDLDVMFWTALIMLPKIGSSAIPEELLFVGPFSRLIRQHVRWFTVDLFVTFIAIGFTGLVFRLYSPLNVGWLRAILLALGFALLFSLTGAILGVNRIAWSTANYADALDLLLPWLIATAIAFFANLVLRFFPWELIIIASILALCGFVYSRYQSRLLTGFIGQLVRHWGKEEAARERVLIIGTGTTAQLAAWLFDHSLNSGKFWTVGFVDDDLFKQGLRIFGAKVIGTCKEIPELVKNHDVGVIVLTDQTIPSEDYRAIIHIRDTTPTKLVILPDIMEALLGFAGTSEMDPLIENDTRAKTFVPCRHCLARQAILRMDKESDQ
jgi:lipopolysaccharide/colanic/teichoic acid biosynthesis glycosyltransferase